MYYESPPRNATKVLGNTFNVDMVLVQFSCNLACAIDNKFPIGTFFVLLTFTSEGRPGSID